MINSIIKLCGVFVVFTLIIVAIVPTKKVNYKKAVVGVLMPPITYFICEIIGNALWIYVIRDKTLAVSVLEAVKWIILSVVYIIAVITIFKAATQKEGSIIQIFKADYKKWNIVTVVLMVTVALMMIFEGVDYTIHQKAYQDMAVETLSNEGFFNTLTGGYLPGYIRVFATLKNVLQKVTLLSLMVPPVISIVKNKK